jgi:hypothetical protein
MRVMLCVLALLWVLARAVIRRWWLVGRYSSIIFVSNAILQEMLFAATNAISSSKGPLVLRRGIATKAVLVVLVSRALS